LDYRFGDKRKTMALGVYPEVGSAKAREDRDEARKLLAAGTIPWPTGRSTSSSA